MKTYQNIEYFQISDIGLTRKHNEDYYSSIALKNGIAFIVCDGMGGHSKGEVASKLACEAVVSFLDKHQNKPEFWLLENAIHKANEVVYNYSQKEDSSTGMGTTIVIALIRKSKLFFAHVGDSRLYLFKNQEAQQLTQDHSYVEELVRNNIISREDAESHPRKNEITRAIGIKPTVEPELCENPFTLHENNFLLLCTDGLSNMLDDSKIKQHVLSTGTVAEKGTKLIDEANTNGGKDNITVTLIQYFGKARNSKRLWFFTLLFLLILGAVFSYLYSNSLSSTYANSSSSTLKEEVQKKSMPKKLSKTEDIIFDLSCLSSDGESEMGWVNFIGAQRDKMINLTTDKVSVTEEMEYGNKFHEAFKETKEIKANRRLSSILKELIKTKPNSDYSYKIYQVEDDEVNALTLGGRIYIFKGMMDFIRSDNELASVISHEIAHNELGHINKSLRVNKTADIFLGTEVSSYAIYFENLLTTPFNQKDEVMADLMGIDLMLRASFNPCEAINLWKRMSGQENQSNRIEELLRSHPYSSKRAVCINQHLLNNYELECNLN